MTSDTHNTERFSAHGDELSRVQADHVAKLAGTVAELETLRIEHARAIVSQSPRVYFLVVVVRLE